MVLNTTVGIGEKREYRDRVIEKDQGVWGERKGRRERGKRDIGGKG